MRNEIHFIRSILNVFEFEKKNIMTEIKDLFTKEPKVMNSTINHFTNVMSCALRGPKVDMWHCSWNQIALFIWRSMLKGTKEKINFQSSLLTFNKVKKDHHNRKKELPKLDESLWHIVHIKLHENFRTKQNS